MWKDNIKMDFRELGIDGVNWIRLAQDRFQWRGFVSTRHAVVTHITWKFWKKCLKIYRNHFLPYPSPSNIYNHPIIIAT
jgi:hypothetical protein